MVTLGVWHSIRSLSVQGWSGRAIAREFGISRNTVAAALRREEPPAYRRTSSRFSALVPHADTIAAGVRIGRCGLVILEQVRKEGYTGSRATFYRYLAKVRREERPSSVSCRFETEPGEQAQFDWSPYVVTIGGRAVRVIIYALALGYSRRVHWFASLSEKLPSVLEGLEEGWRHFGGSCRQVVVDNARSMVVCHRGSNVTWNRRFLALCGSYRVTPIACTPRHPQSKGKVENPFRSLEVRFIRGGEWRDFDHFVAELSEFEANWERRKHGTTGEPPIARFEREREHLTPLPRNLFMQGQTEARIVNNDCLFSYEGVRYFAPVRHGGDFIRVRTLRGRELLVLDAAGNELVRHVMQPKGSPPVIPPGAYTALNERHLASLPGLTHLFRTRYGVHSPVAETFLAHLLRQHPHRPERALGAVMELLSACPLQTALSAIADAVEFNMVTPAALAVSVSGRPGGVSAQQGGSREVPMLGFPVLDIERPISVYGRALDDMSAGSEAGI